MVRPKPTAGLGVSVNIKWVILEVAKNGGTPSYHPNVDNFSIETSGIGNVHFKI